MRLLILLLSVWLISASVYAGEAQPMAENPVIEARMLALSKELRCVVCQNESLAASQAALAQDLRQEIRDMMLDGMSDTQIVEFFVERYGDFVLYNPPLKPLNYVLWFGPAILLILGFITVFFSVRKRRLADDAKLSSEDHRRAQELLGGERKQ